jgi:hypothetical protein
MQSAINNYIIPDYQQQQKTKDTTDNQQQRPKSDTQQPTGDK